MGWLDNIKQAFGNVHMRLPFVRLIGHEKTYGKAPVKNNMDDQVKEYKSWAYACITRNAFSIAKAKLRIYKQLSDGELDEVAEHPFLDLLKNVNPNMNNFELKCTTSLHQDLTGNAYWWMPKGQLGIPVAIWPIPAHWMRIIPDKRTFIAGYAMKVPGEAQPFIFKADEIVHFKYPNPADLFYGASPTQAAGFPIDINNQTKLWSINFLNNNAQPAGVLQTDGTLGDKQYNRLRDLWNRKHRGSQNAGKFAILEQGLKYEKTGSNLQDLAMDDVNKIVRDEILAVYGVPASKLGLVEDVNRANADANDYTYQKETIAPRLMLIEEKINEKIMPLYDERLVCKFDSPVPEDKEYRLREQQIHIASGYSSIDDEREQDEQEPYNQPETQNPLIPFNLAPAGAPKEEPQPAGAGAEKPPKEKPEKKAYKRSKLVMFENTVKPQEKMFERTMRKFFDNQQNIIMQNINHMKSVKDLGMDEDSLAGNILFNLNEQNAKLKAAATPHIRTAYQSGLDIASAELGISFELQDANILRALDLRIGFFSPAVNEATVGMVKDAVAAGVKNGEGIDAIARRLMEIGDFNSRVRATRVAQTEVVGAANDGQMGAYREAGITHKSWLTARDEKVRASHSANEQQGSIPMTHDFKNGLGYPGDRTKGSPGEVINCRCTLLPEKEGDQENG